MMDYTFTEREIRNIRYAKNLAEIVSQEAGPAWKDAASVAAYLDEFCRELTRQDTEREEARRALDREFGNSHEVNRAFATPVHPL